MWLTECPVLSVLPLIVIGMLYNYLGIKILFALILANKIKYFSPSNYYLE